MLMRKKIEYFFYNLRKQKSKNSIYFNLYFNNYYKIHLWCFTTIGKLDLQICVTKTKINFYKTKNKF